MPPPLPPSIDVKQTLIDIARADEQLFHIIEYTQNVPKEPVKSPTGSVKLLSEARTPLTSKWYFEDTFICMDSEVQKWLNGVSTVFKDSYNGNSNQDTVSVLIALIQYAIIYKNKDVHEKPIFNNVKTQRDKKEPVRLDLIADAMMRKFDTGDDKGTSGELRNKIREEIYTDKPYTPTYVLGHECPKPNTQPWRYLVIVMMKRKLVMGFARDAKSPGTVQEAVLASYKDSMLILHDICKESSMYGYEPETYMQLMKDFDTNLIPDAEGTLRLNLQNTLVDVVQEWYTWFLIQRVFGRRIASIVAQYIEQKDDASRRVCISFEIEKQWMNASLDVSTGEFNVAQFVDQCRMSSDKNNRLSDFLAGCEAITFFKDITSKMETMCKESKQWQGLVYAERSSGPLRINVTALGTFLKHLFAAFGIDFETKPRISGITPSIPCPRQPDFRREDFRTFRARRRGVGSSVITAGVAVRTADLAVVKTNWSLGTRGGVNSSPSGTEYYSQSGSEYEYEEDAGSLPEPQGVDHWKDFDGRIRKFRAAYVKYNTRNDIGPTGGFQPEEYKQQCEAELDNLIHKNLGIRHKTDKTHISTDICTFLRHLESPQTYQLALGLVVGILSKNYSSMFSITKMRPLSNTPKNWEGWSDQFDFFISLLLASLLYDMGDAASDSSVLDIELCRYEMDQSVGLEWLKDKASESLTDTECRLYLYRGICWGWMKKIFKPTTESTAATLPPVPKETYTLNDMLSLIWKARTTSELSKSQYRTLKSYENKIYSWKRDGYDILSNEKNIIEHTLCVILIVAGVDNLKGSVMYDGIRPPPLVEDTTEKQPPTSPTPPSVPLPEANKSWRPKNPPENDPTYFDLAELRL
jgi:hypothetical protein